MDVLQLSIFSAKVAVLAAPLAVSLLGCSKKQPKAKKMKTLKKADPPSKRDRKSIAGVISKDTQSEPASISKKKVSVKEKRSDDANNSIKSQSLKDVSKKEDSRKDAESKKAEQQANGKPEDNSAKSISKKSSKMANNDESSKKAEDSRKEDSNMDSSKSVSVKAGDKQLTKDVSVKKGSGALPKESIAVEPKELYVSAGQNVTTKLNLENKSETRKAIKIKCSDNKIFHISPVYALIEPNSKAIVEVSRAMGSAKPDKLAVVVAEASADTMDGKEVFQASPAIDELVTVNVPVFAC